MMSRVECIPPTEVKIGMRVVAAIVDHKGSGLVVFRPAAGAPGEPR